MRTALTALVCCLGAQACGDAKALDCTFPRSDTRAAVRDILNAPVLDVPNLQAQLDFNGAAPSPETPERYRPLIVASPLSDDERLRATQIYRRDVEGLASQEPTVLRYVAYGLLGLLHLGTDEDISTARRLSTQLNNASREAGVRYSPFPTELNDGSRIAELGHEVQAALAQCGLTDSYVTDRWIHLDLRPEEHFFDTGEVGRALARLSTTADDPELEAWLDSAVDWARSQELSANFNYNAFMAGFLAEAAQARNDPALWEEAERWLLAGVIPGMIAEGDDAGHWLDAHNERLAYRTIMVREMARVSLIGAGLGLDEARLAPLMKAHNTALSAIESQFRDAGGLVHVSTLLEMQALAERGEPVGLKPFDPDIRDALMAQAAELVRRGRGGTSEGVAIFLADSP